MRGRAEAVRLLLEHGANVNAASPRTRIRSRYLPRRGKRSHPDPGSGSPRLSTKRGARRSRLLMNVARLWGENCAAHTTLDHSEEWQARGKRQCLQGGNVCSRFSTCGALRHHFAASGVGICRQVARSTLGVALPAKNDRDAESGEVLMTHHAAADAQQPVRTASRA